MLAKQALPLEPLYQPSLETSDAVGFQTTLVTVYGITDAGTTPLCFPMFVKQISDLKREVFKTTFNLQFS
jgi:hypothetical protein